MQHRFPPPTPVDSSRGEVVTVLLSSWEVECCGPLPTVGESTFLRVQFVPADEYEIPALLRSWTWTLSAVDGSGAAATSGGFGAYWADAPAVEGTVTAVGYLVGGRHGGLVPDEIPALKGEIRRVQVVSCLYDHDVTDRQFTVVPGSTRLRDVRRSPRPFGRRLIVGSDPPQERHEDGLVLDVRLSPREAR